MTIMNLWNGLRLEQNSRVAFVGAGGKTTSMFACARDYGHTILLTTTTHLAVEETSLADFAYEVNSPADVDKIFSTPVAGVALFFSASQKTGRVSGPSFETLQCLRKNADNLNCPLFIEADGSRGIPLKASFEHEPVIPEWVNHVIVVCGLSAIGKPASNNTIYNMNTFLEMSIAKPGEPITAIHILNVLLNNRGGRKNIANSVRSSVFFNQWDTLVADIDEFCKTCKPLLEKYDQVLIGNAGKNIDPPEIGGRIEKTAGIILAAGKSGRFGKPKQLLEWNGKPFVRCVTEKAILSGLDPVIVVLGAVIDPIKKVLEDLPVKIVINPEWESGQASSIHSALSALKKLNPSVGGALFFVSDMPQVSEILVKKLISMHQKLDCEIVSPRINGHRINPVLFDQKVFPELEKITGDQGGRILFKDHRVTWVELNDPLYEIDVDEVSDYETLLRMGNQNDC